MRLESSLGNDLLTSGRKDLLGWLADGPLSTQLSAGSFMVIALRKKERKINGLHLGNPSFTQGLIWKFLIMIIFNELVKGANFFWAEPVV